MACRYLCSDCIPNVVVSTEVCATRTMSSILERDVLDALSYMTLHRLVSELSIENANPARDWRGFADLVGFSARHIRTIDQQPMMGKAMKVLEVWDQTGKSSLRKLILALNILGLVSSLDVLKEDRDVLGNGALRLSGSCVRVCMCISCKLLWRSGVVLSC